MSVFETARQCSINGPTQYVLRKSLYEVYCDYGRDMLGLLKEGYEVRAKYADGHEDGSYLIEGTEAESVKAYLHAENEAELLIVHFRVFYGLHSQVTATRVCVVFFESGTAGNSKLYLKDAEAEKLLEFIRINLTNVKFTPDILKRLGKDFPEA